MEDIIFIFFLFFIFLLILDLPAPRRPEPLRSTRLGQIEFLFLISRQGKTRLTKWYGEYSSKDRLRAVRDVTNLVLGRPPKMCAFIEWRDKKIVYKRYASLFFVACIGNNDNELITLEKIHLFVEILDR